MRRWLLPFVAGVIAAFAAYHIALVQTPRVLMSAAVKRVGVAGMNRMSHGPLATDKSRATVRPSPDLAYRSCPFDLTHGPVRITVPPVASSYWSLSVFDARTEVVFLRNNRETAGKGIEIILARPGQKTPPDTEVVRVDAAKRIALVRALVQ